MAQVGIAQVLIVPSFDGLQKSIGKGLDGPLTTQGSKSGKNLGDMIVSGTTKAFKWGGIAAGAALGTAITAGFGRLRAMEDATAKIEGLGYAATEVEQIMTDVQGALDGTMFLYSEGADVAAGALAAGVKQGEELEAYLRLTADAATQAGIDFGTMGHMMNKVSSSGKLTGDVLNQLEQNGVYVGAAIADSLGVTQEEFRKMVSAGEVSADVFQTVMEDQFAGSSEKAADTMSGAMSLAWTAVGQMGEKLIQEVYPYLKEFFQGFYDWVQEISPAVEDFGKRVGAALGSVIGWISANPGAIKVFAAAISSVFAAMAAYTVVVKVDKAIKALNMSFAANPVGLWVAGIAALVTVLVWAWHNVDWFRDAVTTAWEWISAAALWAWEDVLEPVIDALVAAWEWVAETFTHVWENYLSPVFDAIGKVVTWLWENIFEPYIGFIMGHFQGLGELFMLTWEHVLKPVFSFLGDIAMWLWENVLSHVFSWIGDNWEFMVLGMQMYWEHILKPVFQFIGAVATWLWENVLEPTFSWIGEHWGSIIDVMKWAWDNVLKPVWDTVATVAGWLWNDILKPTFSWIGDAWSGMSDRITSIYDNYIQPIFDTFGTAVDTIKDAFGTAVDTIKEQWDKLKKITAIPINFVIETVYNNGIRKLFNSMVDTFGLDKDKWHLSKISPVEFATGGWTGPGGKYDPAGVVHADEFVVQKSSRRSFESENPGLLDHVNRYGTMAGYADGGLVRPVRGGRITSGFGAGRGRYPHAGIDLAVPIGTPVFAAMDGTALGRQPAGRTGRYVFLTHGAGRYTYYGHLSQPLVRPGESVVKGQRIALSGNTGNSTGPHLHWETWANGNPVDPARYLMGSSLPKGTGGPGDVPMGDPTSSISSFIVGIINSVTGKHDGKWADANARQMKRVSEAGVDAASDAAQDVALAMLGSGGNLGGFIGGLIGGRAGRKAGEQKVRDDVQGVANRYGWGSGREWDALSTLIQRESSWNPGARNPNSSAQGLFQKMTSMHGPLETTNAAQAEWGLNYIFNKYGTPSRALAFHDRNNWYADGGRVTQPDHHLFRDQGGNLPPGLSMVLNNSGRDEAILNHQQWSDIHKLATRGGSGGERHYHYHSGRDGATIGDFTREIDHRTRRLERV